MEILLIAHHYYYYIVGLKQYKVAHLAWTIGNGDHIHTVCIPHRIPNAWEQHW